MGNYFKSHLASYRQEAIGLVFFLTWLYCTLFGCGLVTESYVYWGLERIWTVAGLAEAVAAIVGLGLVGRIDKPRLRTLAILGTVCAIAGAFAIWLGYYDHDLFWTCRIIGGSLCGIAITSLILAWGARLCTYNEAQIEFAVPASFALAFALYCAILLLKTSSIAVLVIDGIFPLISMHYLLKGRDSEAPVEGHVGPTMKRTSLRDIASLLVLIAFLWFEIAYFRVISTPLELGDRYWHFLIPFSSSCLVALVLFLFCIKLSRYMNFTLVFRWALPLALVSYALLYMNFEDPTQRILAYTVNFVGMFGVQFGCWMTAPKYLRRTGESAAVLFLGLAAAQGIGIYVGCKTSMILLDTMPERDFLTLSIFIMAIVLLVAMAVGFNPRWLFNRAPDGRHRSTDTAMPEGAASETPDGMSANLQTIFSEQADRLHDEYGLTERETEVAMLLLAGRSRPYIRDELTVSLNTVNAHARSIFVKCNVHSQQELMDLARSSGSTDVSFE